MIQLFGLVLALGLIIWMVMRRVNLGLSLIVGSLVLGIAFGFSAGNFVHLFESALRDPLTVELSLIVALVGILTYCMKEMDLTTEFVGNLERIVSSRWILAFVPAFFGTLPMTGGARISAPYVEEGSRHLRLKAEVKSSMNIWFRHVWMLILPIMPPLILASWLAGIGLYKLILLQLPFSALYLLTGYLVFIRPIPSSERFGKERGNPRRVILILSPILVVILSSVLGIPLPLALALGVGTAFAIKKTDPRKSLGILWRGIPLGIVFAVVGIMIFRHAILESHAFDLVFSSLIDVGIPSLFFLTALPLLFGFVSGTASGAVGVYFPLILSVANGIGIGSISVLYLSIIFGYIVSPLHLCTLLTIDYFKSELRAFYRSIVPSVLFVYSICLASLLMFF